MRKRDKRGRYAKQYRTATLADKILVMSVLAFGLGTVLVEEYKQLTMPVEAYSIEKEEIKEEPKEVRVEVVYEWDEERVKKEIAKVFPDNPIMQRVAWCESRYDLDAYNPTNNSHDIGLMQISQRYHSERAERLGYDLHNPYDNIRFAKVLYNENGLRDWYASRHCWSK